MSLSKHGHVTKIFCDIAIRKSLFHGVLTARSIHLFYDVVFVFNPFAAGATVVLISASTWKGKLNVSNQWISRKIIGLLQFKLMRMNILYIHILQIIIKYEWTLNEAIHEIFVKHLKCIKMQRSGFPSVGPSVTFYVNKAIFT